MEKKKFKTDLTVGSVKTLLIKYALPLVASSLLQNLYNIVDTVCVGNIVGDAGLAAVGNCFPIIWLVISVFLGLSIGTIVLISQYAGANDRDNLAKVFSTNNALFIICGVVMTVIGLSVARPILRAINTAPEVMPLAADYLTIMFSGILFTALYNLGSAYMRGLGDSKTPLIFVAITTALNLPLDIIFIGGLGALKPMGVSGAAVATIISQATSVLLCIIYLRRRQHKMGIVMLRLKIYPDALKKTVRIGVFTAIQQALVSLSFTVVIGMINTFGTVAAGAYGAGSKIDAIIIMPAQAMQQSVAAVSAQNIGANKYDRARDALKYGVLYNLAMCFSLAVLVFFFGKYAMRLFIDSQPVINEGARYLKFMAINYIPLGMLFAINGMLQGSGDARVPMFFTLISNYLVRIPAAYLFMTKYGSTGIYLGIIIGPMISLMFAFLYYKSGRWAKKRLAGKIYDE